MSGRRGLGGNLVVVPGCKCGRKWSFTSTKEQEMRENKSRGMLLPLGGVK